MAFQNPTNPEDPPEKAKFELIGDIQAIKPTIFGSFPLFFNKIYRRTIHQVKILETDKLSNELIFQQIRNLFGGKIRMLISGGAPLSEEVSHFFKEALGCPIFECYGATESAGCVASTSYWETQSGVAGGPLSCLKMKLRDLPNEGYLSTDDPPRGGVCLKGNSIFKGYFRNPELTAEVLDNEGWLCLGDVAIILPCGCLQLIDRVSNISKLQTGQFVAPAFLEYIYGQANAVSQVFVSANSKHETIVAVIVPEKDYLLRNLAKAEGKPDLDFYLDVSQGDYQKLLESSETVQGIIVKELKQKEDQYHLPENERVANQSRFYLTASPFTVAHSEPMQSLDSFGEASKGVFNYKKPELSQSAPILTHTMKIKRNEAELYYSEIVSQILKQQGSE